MEIFLSRMLKSYLLSKGSVRISGGKGGDPSDLLVYVLENPNATDGRQRFSCSLCGKTAARTKDVRDHVENIHFPNMFTYQCDLCAEMLKSKTALKNHKISHKSMWKTLK